MAQRTEAETPTIGELVRLRCTGHDGTFGALAGSPLGPLDRVEGVGQRTATAAPAPAAQPPRQPWPKHLSLAIFGAFAFIGLLECVAAAVTTTTDDSAERSALSKASPA